MDSQLAARSIEGADDGLRRVFGVVVGIVTDNRDAEARGRVKVRLPSLDASGDGPVHWARVALPLSGRKRGPCCLPEVDDEVLVAFEQGFVDRPYVIGALWNGQAAPAAMEIGPDERRGFKSRSGHVVWLDEREGAETIEITDRTGNNRIVIRSSDNTLSIEADGDVFIKSSTGKLSLSGVGVEIRSLAGIDVQADLDVDVRSSAQVNLRGTLVNLN